MHECIHTFILLQMSVWKICFVMLWIVCVLSLKQVRLKMDFFLKQLLKMSYIFYILHLEKKWWYRDYEIQSFTDSLFSHLGDFKRWNVRWNMVRLNHDSKILIYCFSTRQVSLRSNWEQSLIWLGIWKKNVSEWNHGPLFQRVNTIKFKPSVLF